MAVKEIKKYIKDRLPSWSKVLLLKGHKLFHFLRGHTAIPRAELALFERIKDDCRIVFDVGAREDISLYAINETASYHLFEPNVVFAAGLKRKVESFPSANITVNEFGLSDTRDDAGVYYEKSQSFVVNPLHIDVDIGVRFPLRTLDEYVLKNNVHHIDFLKIDAEGLDYRIILGGLTTIKENVTYIQFEYWDGVKKFTDLLGEYFNLYLMMEPVLLRGALGKARTQMTDTQKKVDMRQSLIPLTDEVINIIDTVFIPLGYGGNIFGISKKHTRDVRKLTFKL